MPHPSVIGRYEVIRLLGAGGMGAVYLARDPSIGGRQLAVKLLRHDEYASEEDTKQRRQRFIQEAHAAGRIESDHVVRIFDVGEYEGDPYIAMEYIDGDTLAALVRRGQPMPLLRKLELMSHLCDGLAAAHTCGIVHRDLKPLNIIVDRKGRLRILDFGIAKLSDATMQTSTGAFMGSWNYVSPEQAAGRPVDHRTDIFAVGAVCYELLCFRQAFPGVAPAVLRQIVDGAPEPLEAAYAESAAADEPLDLEVVQIVGRALAKAPEDRYQRIDEMHAAIEAVRRRLASAAAARTTTPVVAPSPTPPADAAPVVDEPDHGARDVDDATVLAPRPGTPARATPQIEPAAAAPVDSLAPTVRIASTAVAAAPVATRHGAAAAERRGAAGVSRKAVTIATVAVAVAGLGVALYRRSPPAAPAPVVEPAPEPETDAGYWARAVKAGSSEAFERYLGFVKERGIAGEHRAEAQTRLAALWSPASLPAPQLVESDRPFKVQGFKGAGCTKAQIPSAVRWSGDGTAAVYSLVRSCRDSRYQATYFERRGEPSFEIDPGFTPHYGRDLSRDGEWVALSSTSRGLIVVNTRDRRVVQLAEPLSPEERDELNDTDNRVQISADGTTIAAGFPEDGGVAVFDRDTARREDLRPPPGPGDSPTTLGPSVEVSLAGMSWNGRWVAFQVAREQNGNPNTDFYVYERDSKRVTRVASKDDGVRRVSNSAPQRSMLVSDSGKWVVFESIMSTRSPLTDTPVVGWHLYAREVATGRTWHVASASDRERSGRKFALSGDVLVMVERASPPSDSKAAPVRPNDLPATIAWRPLPNGAALTRPVTTFGQALLWSANTETCVLDDKKLTCVS